MASLKVYVDNFNTTTIKYQFNINNKRKDHSAFDNPFSKCEYTHSRISACAIRFQCPSVGNSNTL